MISLFTIIITFYCFVLTSGQTCTTNSDCASLNGVCCGTAPIQLCYSSGTVCCYQNGAQVAAACPSGYSCSVQGLVSGTYQWTCSQDSKNYCFAGNEQVYLESGENKYISDVSIGDRILSYSPQSSSLTYSDVVAVPHQHNSQSALFTAIHTEKGRNIKLSPEHLIPIGNCDNNNNYPLVPASSVKVGSCIMTVSGKDKVTSTNSETDSGLYTVVTGEEYIVVNGVVASPFAVNHFIPNMFYNIHRLIYSLMPSVLKSSFFTSVETVANDISNVFINTKETSD